VRITVYDIAEAVKLILLASILYVLARNPAEPKRDYDCINGVVRVTAYAPSVVKINFDEMSATCQTGEQ
jgi:hypothetical protein